MTCAQGEGVTYRGAFINDEDWCLAPWCEARNGKERGICAEVYREIFADMKSRRLNLLWPAMHPGGYEFCSRKENLDAARGLPTAPPNGTTTTTTTWAIR